MIIAAPPSRRTTRNAVLAAAALAAVVVVVGAVLVTGREPASSAPSVKGNATHFSGFASTYGGCGVPQGVLDSPNFVSLNVFDTPGDYSTRTRPLSPSESGRIGRFENGRNCGRFVQVTIGNRCTGVNDGAQGQPFCREGSWISDEFNGATLIMVVADGCADPSAWCRDDPDHLGVSTSSLAWFTKDGAPVGHIDPDHWNNRHVSWSYVPTPDYSGDLRIGFLRDAGRAKPVIAVSHLRNGVHGVEYLGPEGGWQRALPNGDMGQSFILGPTEKGGTDYRVRVRDASDSLVEQGRVYRFSLPATCSSGCSETYAEVDYTTEAPSSETWGSAAVPTTTASSSSVVPTTTAVVTTTTTARAAPAAPVAPVAPKTTVKALQAACTATYRVVNSWQGGRQVDVTVRNTGAKPLSGWRTTFSVDGSQRFTTPWNAVVNQSGGQVVAVNQNYNGSLAAGASTSWGAIVSGVDRPVTGMACAPR
ncbi:cellulose binding domain-containing protein [Umezawaea sp. Da 62-37]|uniref:cellulose binding domain-containing protein n=1 Tax=Umezawaea sp. Da 62-37 TaxID=3075927 RepID=UPI0028F6C23D|nr:cellulose binding domain-containing protein [Umezawaea sp. Da 62-37]WNV88944.1 cellulose binding domain-containing protein [Umezawaea sp. Da 62-37]